MRRRCKRCAKPDGGTGSSGAYARSRNESASRRRTYEPVKVARSLRPPRALAGRRPRRACARWAMAPRETLSRRGVGEVRLGGGPNLTQVSPRMTVDDMDRRVEKVFGGGNEFVTTRIDPLLNWARKYSLFAYPFATACCAMEFMGVWSPRFDVARFGAELPRFSPRQSDLLWV